MSTAGHTTRWCFWRSKIGIQYMDYRLRHFNTETLVVSDSHISRLFIYSDQLAETEHRILEQRPRDSLENHEEVFICLGCSITVWTQMEG